MDFLIEYGLFVAKTITLVLAILFIVGGIATAVAKNRRHASDTQGEIVIEDLGQYYKDLALETKEEILSKDDYKKVCKEEKRKEKAQQKSLKKEGAGKRLFVLDFDGDIEASQVAALREEITTVLSVVQPEDEVLLRLESPGGMVHSYGLAASQLKRIRDRGIKLTIAVDSIAASGGYLMASVGHRIVAAPFAIIGSIGVMAQLPNFHRLLRKHDVDVEQHTAGEYKLTLTMFGENTDKAREKFRQELVDIHHLFKEFLQEHRPQIDMSQVATGEHWYGSQAVALGLVDELMTSDDYLLHAVAEMPVFAISYQLRKTLGERLGLQMRHAMKHVFAGLMQRIQEQAVKN